MCAASCSENGVNVEEDLTLDEEIYGFYLGEKMDTLFARSKNRLAWEKLPDPRTSYRGEMYRLSGALDGSREISHVRLAFLDGYLMEIIVYFKDTSVPRLRSLKKRLEKQYNARGVAPDGSKETVYKTYRLPGPGMSITLRRITKKYETELYIQYFHKELQRRLIERNKGS